MRISIISLIVALYAIGCSQKSEVKKEINNPFFVGLNEPIQFAIVTPQHIEEYAEIVLENTVSKIDDIKNTKAISFENIFIPFDAAMSDLGKSSNNCFTLYWVSPDSLSRVKGLDGNQLLDSLSTTIFSNKKLYELFVSFANSSDYKELKGNRKNFVDDLISNFEQSGVNLEPEKLDRFKKLTAEINKLTSEYSINMNTANQSLILSGEETAGLTDNFKQKYVNEDGNYVIPAIPATRKPMLENAENEKVRNNFFLKYNNRASDKNLDILEELVKKRYELGTLMGKKSYAEYNLKPKMAGNSETVWKFVNDLREKSYQKALADHDVLKKVRNETTGVKSDSPINAWDWRYYHNTLLKTKYQVDHEKIREYFPMKKCLKEMMSIYQELLNLEFRKVDSASVWHEEVEMYEVLEDGNLKGRFYLDLFPRPNKESWFYKVGLTEGRQTQSGYEVPVSMLLGNFTRPTETLPSLLSFSELNTLFHEFGHIMDGMSYNGEFAYQAGSKSDFGEAMSQIFENWLWDYDILSSLSSHYESEEVLPKEMFDGLVSAKKVSSGLFAQSSLRNCVYDLNLYDLYDPEKPFDSDEIWREIDKSMPMPMYVEGTHGQSSWIHINTHPVYYYGYLWSEVYAQDMFTVFEQNGLKDTETGKKYRQLILANGTQRDIVEAVKEFIGRSSNNEAYIKSLGLN